MNNDLSFDELCARIIDSVNLAKKAYQNKERANTLIPLKKASCLIDELFVRADKEIKGKHYR